MINPPKILTAYDYSQLEKRLSANTPIFGTPKTTMVATNPRRLNLGLAVEVRAVKNGYVVEVSRGRADGKVVEDSEPEIAQNRAEVIACLRERFDAILNEIAEQVPPIDKERRNG